MTATDKETRWYWTCIRAARIALRDNGPADPEFGEMVDELECLALHTDCPLLKRRIAADLEGFRREPAQAGAAT